MTKVFITDAEQGRVPLCIIRSLGKAGFKVYVGSCLKIATPYFSRYCSKKIVYPNPSIYPAKFKQFMFDYLKKEQFDAVFPTSNSSVLFFSKYKKELSKYTIIPLADYDQMILAMDKSNTFKIAEKIGIPCPKTYYPLDLSELKEMCEDFSYPVIIKPRKGAGAVGVKICQNKTQLIWNFMYLSKTYGPPLVQEYIPKGGDTIGVSCLFDCQHQEKVVFVHKRLREYPINGGPSTLRESIRHPEAEKLAVKLLKKLNWFGVAMVEFKIDPRDNKPKLMEINPRFWGSLSLPIMAGVNFPLLLYKLVTTGEVEKVENYPVGIKSRWLGGDFLNLLHSKNKFKSLREFFDFSDKNTFCEDFVPEDPLPTFARPLSFVYLYDKTIRGLIFRYR